MFESLLNPKTAERRPSEMFFLAIALTIISSWLGAIIGKGNEVGHLVVAFICIGVAPLIVHMIWIDEIKGEKRVGNLLSRHWPTIEAYAFFFLGVAVGTSLVYLLLPTHTTSTMFSPQLNELKAIKTLATGNAISTGCGFECILVNNLTVLLFALIFSFLLGAGAVYIVSWNASIVGILLGVMTVETAAKYGINKILAYFIAIPLAILRLLPHGIFEITGYLIGGIAGGMLSAALIRGGIKEKQVLADIATMIGLSIILIVIGAAIENS